MSDIEQWRPIPGYPYEASSLGNIRNAKTLRVLKHLPDNRKGHGYARVAIAINGFSKFFTIHRLVAAAFIGPYPDGLEIDHLDGDRRNNRPENLEYVTKAENRRRSRHNYKRGDEHPGRKLTEADVREVRRLRADGWSYPKLGVKFGVHSTTMLEIALGRTWTHVT